MRGAGCGFVPIVLVVVLVLVIEKAEYVRMMKWGVEDEYESPAGYSIWDRGFRISDLGSRLDT